MAYKEALDKAWNNIEKLTQTKRFKVKFLADEYDIDVNAKMVFSSSCNAPPHEHISVLILHYLVKRINGLPKIAGKWISFNELPGGQGYYEAFRKRALEPVKRKYGNDPKALKQCLERLPGKEAKEGDAGVILEVFENVPVLITVWGKDEEFTAAANMHFDGNITSIFCTEDAAVMSDIISRAV